MCNCKCICIYKLCMYMYIYMYECMYVCICICICIPINEWKKKNIYIHTHINIYIHIYIYIHMWREYTGRFPMILWTSPWYLLKIVSDSSMSTHIAGGWFEAPKSASESGWSLNINTWGKQWSSIGFLDILFSLKPTAKLIWTTRVRWGPNGRKHRQHVQSRHFCNNMPLANRKTWTQLLSILDGSISSS